MIDFCQNFIRTHISLRYNLHRSSRRLSGTSCNICLWLGVTLSPTLFLPPVHKQHSAFKIILFTHLCNLHLVKQIGFPSFSMKVLKSIKLNKIQGKDLPLIQFCLGVQDVYYNADMHIKCPLLTYSLSIEIPFWLT